MENTGIERQFGLAVRNERRKLALTQEELADQAGLHRTYVSDVERGKRNLSIQSIERLARAMNISIGALFAESEPRPDAPNQC